ncbi:MAG TPA: hypothetical protein VNW92_12415 [Polyangiaceae bacterium]|jgi:hypothetical protein|nr:hypothetical protein [Polyangiaceae bacterium]
MRVVPALALWLGLTSSTRVSRAEPEWNVAAQTSLCGLGEHGKVWEKTGFCGAVRGDLLFGRERNADFAWGPYATLGTAKFSDARFGAGLSLLVPTFGGDFPVVLSAGALSRNGTDARVSGQLFFGLRSHNFHGAYAMASGFVLGGDAGMTDNHGTTLYAGLQVDGLWLALPFILGYEWLKPSPDPGD